MGLRLTFAVLLATLIVAPLRGDYLLSGKFVTPTGSSNYMRFPDTDGDAAVIEFFGHNSQGFSPSNSLTLATITGVHDDQQDSGITSSMYTILATLTDSATGASGELSFSAMFSARVGPAWAKFTSHEFIEPATKSLTLGDHRYDVSVSIFDPLSSGTKYWGFFVRAQIEVSPAVATAPEPSTLLLAASSALAFCGWRWRRRKGSNA